MTITFASPTEILTAIAPLAAEPARTAAFFDLDGTLAPVVERSEDARVPNRTRELVERIGERYGVAGVITGRQASDARGILGLAGITYVGNHGFEVLLPGEDEAEPAPALAGEDGRAAAFVASLSRRRLDQAGLRLEDKGTIQALHWRGAEDPGSAQRAAVEIGAEAVAAGLWLHRGRMVLELRPPVDLDKGAGLRSVLRSAPVRAALYAGDDRTDIDVFAALTALVAEGRLERALRIAVASEESPEALVASADLAVDGPDGFLAVLEALA